MLAKCALPLTFPVVRVALLTDHHPTDPRFSKHVPYVADAVTAVTGTRPDLFAVCTYQRHRDGWVGPGLDGPPGRS